jgi:hypothetical protein
MLKVVRCPKGTRRNKKTGLCEPNKSKSKTPVKPKTPVVVKPKTPVVKPKTPLVIKPLVVAKPLVVVKPKTPVVIKPLVVVKPKTPTPKKRCPKGTKRNKKTGLCEPHKDKSKSPAKAKTPVAVVKPKTPVAVIKPKTPVAVIKPKTPVAVVPVAAKAKSPLALVETRKEQDELIKKQKKASEIIIRFMNKTKHKRKAEYFKGICSDSSVCIAFGTHSDEITKFFNGFKEFYYVVSPIKSIGGVSANGFINEIKYVHRGYESYAVLKSAIRPGSDNLLYEYMVGLYVNKLNKLYPCFLQTYSYYTYKSDNDWKIMKSKSAKAEATAKVAKVPKKASAKVAAVLNKTKEDVIKHGLDLHKDVDYTIACLNSKYVTILVQHLKDIKSLYTMSNNSTFCKQELLYALAQVYIPLSTLMNNFTHYDLHTSNVVLYEPVKDSYLEYHYHLVNGTVVTFKSKYIVKIIDYGRSYFNDTVTNRSSKTIYDEMFKTKECTHNLVHSGLYYLSTLDPTSLTSSQKKNASYDLRLLNNLRMSNKNKPFTISPELATMLNKVVFGVGIAEKKNQQFGTLENLASGLPGHINNLMDAATELISIIRLAASITNNNTYYSTSPKIGDLHIYCDNTTPMRFDKA